MSKKRLSKEDFVENGTGRRYVPYLATYYEGKIGEKFRFIEDFPFVNHLNLSEEKMKEKLPHLFYLPKKDELWELVDYDVFCGFTGSWGGDDHIEDHVLVQGLSGRQKQYPPTKIPVSLFYELAEEAPQ